MKKLRNKIINLLSNKIASVILVLAFILFWFVGSFLFVNYVSFSVLTDSYGFESSKEKLFNGHSVSSEFKAAENNLGLIMLSFEEYAKPDYEQEDQLRFEIKEKNASKIYFSSVYRSGLVDGGYFPFGFPTIADSKDKTYQFRLTSLKGNEKNGLTLSNNNFVSGYQFSKAEIFGNKNNLIKFFISKLNYSIRDSYLLLSSVMFMLPLIAYLLFLIGIKKNRRFDKLIIIAFIVLLAASLFLIGSYYGVLGLNIILWIYIIWRNNLKSTATFKLAFTILFIWLFIKFINVDFPQNNLNIISYSLLVLGVVQLILEEKRNAKI
jgi:hypothetical protein